MQKTISKKKPQSTIFDVKIGYFTTSISILNVHKNVKDFDREAISSGTYAHVYVTEFSNKKYAIKSQIMSLDNRARLN